MNKQESSNYFAHINYEEERFQSLCAHLEEVAQQAADFAAEFNSRDWGYIAALWHDLGKYDQNWQAYLKNKTGYDTSHKGKKGQHSLPGALACVKRGQEAKWCGAAQLALAYVIAGHHAGLADWSCKGGTLQQRLYEEGINQSLKIAPLRAVLANEEARDIYEYPLPTQFPLAKQEQLESFPLWIRMLFSCVVDADSLNTEKFETSAKAILRKGFDSIAMLSEKLDAFLAEKSKSSPPTPLNLRRQDILNDCQNAALLPPGFFSLTVPTGGGKTLSSLSFAFRHAQEYDKKRVIVGIPYTSIIEQTALVYKYGTDDLDEIERGATLLGAHNVLEHHSAFVINDDEEESEEYCRHRLATENWDVPLIVTTNVQLFESLHSCRRSQCRKLHNIANSVIILDEAQNLPEEYLFPILATLKSLVRDFNVSVVFCTATQPAFEGEIGSPPAGFLGITDVREIVRNPHELAADLNRTVIAIDNEELRLDSWDELADKLEDYHQVLCIVNTRADCAALYHAVASEDTWYLSGLMCPEDRTVCLSGIKKNLREGKPVRVISTQLIEAGVDIDFPVVYRALTGLDSIVQSAGRCNREGRAKGKGKVFVFWPPEEASRLRGSLRRAADSTISLMSAGGIDFTNPDTFKKYFRRYYADVGEFGKANYDKCFLNNRYDAHFEFRSYSDQFHLIDDELQRTILVRYRNAQKNLDSRDLLERFTKQALWGYPDLKTMRKLQRFSVSVPDYRYRELLENHRIQEIGGVGIQVEENLYVAGRGLNFDCEMSLLYM